MSRVQELHEALEHPAGISWQPTTARYLRGEPLRGSLRLPRVPADGRTEEAGP